MVHRALSASYTLNNREDLYETGNSLLLKRGVTPVLGSVVWCDLAFFAEHSGIYVGGNKIVHLDGSGEVQLVSKKEFMDRLGGFNNAINIYVSCRGNTAVGSAQAARIAKQWVGKKRDYHLLVDNCHRFSAGCILNNFADGDDFLYFSQLATICGTELNATEWRPWE